MAGAMMRMRMEGRIRRSVYMLVMEFLGAVFVVTS